MTCPRCKPSAGDSRGGELNLRLSSEKVLPCRPGKKRAKPRCLPRANQSYIPGLGARSFRCRSGFIAYQPRRGTSGRGCGAPAPGLGYVERCSGERRGAVTGQTPTPAKNCGSAVSVMAEGYMLGRIGGIGEAGMCPPGGRMVFGAKPSCPRRDGGGTLPGLCRQGYDGSMAPPRQTALMNFLRPVSFLLFPRIRPLAKLFK